METDREARRVVQRALATEDPALLQLVFRSEVLDAYRGRPGFSIIRTDSAGRVKQDGGWALDFGISDGDALIHASWRDLVARLPPSEREHWASHAVSLPLSRNFVQMQTSPGSCLDDGDIRPW